MIDFHVHVGERLGVAEALWTAGQAGYRGLGLLAARLEDIGRIRAEARTLGLFGKVEAVVGFALDHVPPPLIPHMVAEARAAGAAFVLMHGEGCDQAEAGTNFAAVAAGVDILARPGLVDSTVAVCAAEKGVALEISTGKWALANGLIVQRAREAEAMLLPGGEVHCAKDFASVRVRRHACLGAGLNGESLDKMEITLRNLWNKFAECEKNLDSPDISLDAHV